MAGTKPNPVFVRVFSSFHRTVVRGSGGRLLTGFKGQPMILLTATGRKSGQARTWPLTGLRLAPPEGHDAWLFPIVWSGSAPASRPTARPWWRLWPTTAPCSCW